MVIFWGSLKFLCVFKIIFIFESSMFDVISIREIAPLNNTKVRFSSSLKHTSDVSNEGKSKVRELKQVAMCPSRLRV